MKRNDAPSPFEPVSEPKPPAGPSWPVIAVLAIAVIWAVAMIFGRPQ